MLFKKQFHLIFYLEKTSTKIMLKTYLEQSMASGLSWYIGALAWWISNSPPIKKSPSAWNSEAGAVHWAKARKTNPERHRKARQCFIVAVGHRSDVKPMWNNLPLPCYETQVMAISITQYHFHAHAWSVTNALLQIVGGKFTNPHAKSI